MVTNIVYVTNTVAKVVANSELATMGWLAACVLAVCAIMFFIFLIAAYKVKMDEQLS